MLNISFNFNEDTHEVTNIKVIEIKNNSSNYDVVVEDNKLSLTSEAVSKLRAVPGDRISINYWMEGQSYTIPIISKSDVFTDGEDGSKMTKSKTISFRGQQRTTLLKFGSKFIFEEFKDKNGNVKDGVFKLKPVVEDDTESDSIALTDEQSMLDEMDETVIEDELAGMLDENPEDILPF